MGLVEKIKNILKIILNYLKSLLVAIFGFFFDLFNNGKTSNELKPKKLDYIKNDDKTIYNNLDISGYDEEPNSRGINNNINFSITDIVLEELIIKRFCEELEIEKNDLTELEKDYVESLKEKITPIIKSNLDNKIITNENDLTHEIKKLVVEELEYQFKLEQKNELPPEKVIITPILKRRKEREETTSNSVSLSNKVSFIETKRKLVALTNDKINSPISSNNDEIDIITNIPINNSEKLDVDYIETLFPTTLDDSNWLTNEYSKKTTSIQENSSITSETSNNYFDIAPPLNNSLTGSTLLENVDLNHEKEEPQTILEEKVEEIERLEEFQKLNDEYQDYNYKKLDEYIQNTTSIFEQESKKEELEDKNYDVLEKQIDTLLNEINKLKLKKLSPTAKKKLLLQENKLLQLKANLNSQKLKDIELEEANLEAAVLNEDLNLLEKELEALHIDDKLDLQNFYINNLEELDMMTTLKAKKIEKELLKIKLKKAIHALEIPSLLALPFIRNKYFMFFTGGLFVNRHLKFFDAILKRKSIQYDPEDLTQIKTGSDAFLNALFLSKQNIEYLETLEMDAFKKYPELRLDADYIIHLNMLKSKLLKQQEKLLKKENMIKKHNIKLNKRIRKLKKKENQDV